MRIRVLAGADEALRLETAEGVPIGWVRDRVVGFRGLPNEQRVFEAVAQAWPAFQAALARHYPGWPRQDIAVGRLEIVDDGATRWIVHEGQRLARLLHVRGKPATHGVEFVLPSYATEGAVISIAQVLGSTMASYVAGAAEDVPLGPRKNMAARTRAHVDRGPLPPAA